MARHEGATFSPTATLNFTPSLNRLASRSAGPETAPLGLFVDCVADSPLQSLGRPMSPPIQAHHEGHRILSFGTVWLDAPGAANLMERVVENTRFIGIADELTKRHSPVLAESVSLVERRATGPDAECRFFELMTASRHLL